MHSFDAEIAFNVKKIRAEEALAILESLRGNAILKSGDLSVSIDKLGLGGGHLNGQTALSSHKEDGLKIESRGKFTHIALPAAAKQIDKKLKDAPLPLDSLFKGKVSGDFALKSHGRSLHDLASHLDGVLSFALEGGELNAALLNLTNLNIIDAVKAWFAKQRGLKVPCIIAHLPIKDGVIRSEGVYANPALGEVLGDGYVDLGQEKYDIRFAAKGDQPIGSDVIFPLRFSGKFGEGRVTRDEGQDSADTSIKEALPHAHQKSVRVEQTEESTGCTKELRERYLPAKVALGRP